MSTERESKTQQKTIQVVRKNGGYVYKNAQSMFTEVGRPDLTVCIPTTVKKLTELYEPEHVVGLFAGIEMKRPGRLDGVSEAQIVVGNQIKKAGGIWLLIDDPSIAEALMLRYGKTVPLQ